jgi:signal peptidase II
MKAVPLNRYLTFFGIIVIGCAIDLATKSWIFNRLGMPGADGTWWVWPEVFGFQTSLNSGALFGLGEGMVSLLAVFAFIALLGIIVWLYVFGAARDWLLTLALASVSAGILGNLYDRLGLPGLTWPGTEQRVYAVRDWIRFSIGNFTWPNFNVADSMLVCGAALLILHAIIYKSNIPLSSTESPSPNT